MQVGWNNAANLHGKDPSEVTTADKFQAAGATAAAGLTFGLVSDKQMLDFSNSVADWMVGNKKQQQQPSNIENTAVYNYITEKNNQKNQLQQQFNKVKDNISQLATDENAPTVIKHLAQSTDPQSIITAVEQNLFKTTEDRKTNTKYGGV